MATEEGRNLLYQDIVRLTSTQEIILVDVREPNEIQETGKIPGSFNIPLSGVKAALELNSPEFEAQFGHCKPGLDSDLVFSCRTDRRSRIAMNQALQMGYHRSKFYEGGITDWLKQTTKSNGH